MVLCKIGEMEELADVNHLFGAVKIKKMQLCYLMIVVYVKVRMQHS